MPFADKTFDYAICSHVLEHVERPDTVIAELTRVAKAGYIEVPDSPGLGMGLPLIAAVTDEVEIVGNERVGNEVRMTFLLSAPEPVAPAELA